MWMYILAYILIGGFVAGLVASVEGEDDATRLLWSAFVWPVVLTSYVGFFLGEMVKGK